MNVNPMAVFREEADGSACLFNPDNGKVFGLNVSGTVLWKAILRGDDIPALIAALKDLGAPEEQAAADLEEFLGKLREKGMLEDDAE